MSAGQCRPGDAVEIDIYSARSIASIRRNIDFRKSGVGRVRPGRQPDEVTRLIDARETDVHRLAPDRVIDRVRLDAVRTRNDELVLRRIDRTFRPDIIVTFAVSVSVD